MNTEMKKTVVYSTGDKILNIMKEQDMDIPELSLRCGVREDVLMDILAGIREADISTLCKIADGLEICVRELCPDEESYVVPVEKDPCKAHCDQRAEGDGIGGADWHNSGKRYRRTRFL